MRPTEPRFPGISKPSIPFDAVRDGRRSVPFYYVVDLTTARTIAAGTALSLNLAGNSFYCDPIIDAAGAPVGGVATVHFQDTNLNPAGTPFTVASQFIARVPFTQLLIENPAQPGKSLRIIYGVDIDFTPGINAQVSITGTVAVTGAGQAYGAKFSSTAGLGAGATETIIVPASNTAGIIVQAGHLAHLDAGGSNFGSHCTAHTSAPAAYTDGDVLFESVDSYFFVAASFSLCKGKLENPLLIAAAKGLYFRNGGAAETGATRSILYTVK